MSGSLGERKIENGKKWEHEPTGRVFPRYFEFFQTSTSVFIIYVKLGPGGDYNVEVAFFIKLRKMA